jgi:hypothetical protein
MRDNKNLLHKINVEYPKIIRLAESRGDIYSAKYWANKIQEVKEKLKTRKINRNKNNKQFRKAN